MPFFCLQLVLSIDYFIFNYFCIIMGYFFVGIIFMGNLNFFYFIFYNYLYWKKSTYTSDIIHPPYFIPREGQRNRDIVFTHPPLSFWLCDVIYTKTSIVNAYLVLKPLGQKLYCNTCVHINLIISCIHTLPHLH